MAASKIHFFIFSWPGTEDNAANLKKVIPNSTVIGGDKYFSEQWNEAIGKFSGDVFAVITADVVCDDVILLIGRIRLAFTNSEIGVYGPRIDYSGIKFYKTSAPGFESNFNVVPYTDSTCIAVRGEIIKAFEPVNLNVNRYGWGINQVVAAITKKHGKVCVEDYAITLKHPKNRGYDTQMAIEQRRLYFDGLSADLKNIIKRFESPQRSSRYLAQTRLSNRPLAF